MNSIIAQHPGFILAHLLKAAYLTQLMETRVYDDMVSAVAAAERLVAKANEREKMHLLAVSAWAKGDYFTALAEWERALARFPHDLLALQIVHLSYVLLGEVAGQRDVVARVFSCWSEKIEGFAFVLGFYAFGLEENGDFERAEQMGMRALELRANDPYALHAICHVMDMQGRQVDGLQFMYDRVDSWASSGFAIHLWWHTALFHLDLQEFDRALEIYDQHLRSSQDDVGRYEEFDAAALLWRLRLVGADTGDRWAELADKWLPAAADTLYAFNNVHAMMALASASRSDAVERLLSSNTQFIASSSGPAATAIREVGLPFCFAIADFHAERYSECVARLLPVRYHVARLGGSFVQREVLGWTLLEAAIRAGDHALALAMANERCALKPNSPQRWLDIARAQEGMSQSDFAAQAKAQAEVWQSRAMRAIRGSNNPVIPGAGES